MRIGELSVRSGVPRTTLRYYERVRLLASPARTESGYRSYGDDAVERLIFIRSAQAVGLTLAEVRQVMEIRSAGEAPCRVVAALIDQRYTEVRSRIAELRQLEHELAQLRARADKLRQRDCEPSGICHVIPALEVPPRTPRPSPNQVSKRGFADLQISSLDALPARSIRRST